jgi:cytochrome c
VNFIALQGLPNPWQRNEEWYYFNNHQVWTAKPGFTILGRKAADGQPIMWTREWGNFRAFYTAIGHDGVVFQDPNVKKHITGGIMWAVRRDHLIK